MNLSDAETGCYIDGSHMDNIQFTLCVIELAHNYGFELDWEQFIKDVTALGAAEAMMEEDELFEILNALDWTYDDALDYLNDTAPDGMYWEVEDSSLFLMEAKDD